MLENFLQVKKRIDIEGVTVLPVGFYKAGDAEKIYPFLNYKDQDYFDYVSKKVINPGTKIKYDYHTYYVIGLYETSYVDSYGRRRLKEIRNRDGMPYLRYVIGTGMEVREKDRKVVWESDIQMATNYWFINSKGDICQAVEGENKRGDTWRKATNNMFSTREEAQRKLDSYLYNEIIKGE